MRAFLYSPNQNACIADQWDFGLLKDLLDDNEIDQTILFNHLPKEDKAIVVIPARHNFENVDIINKNLKNIKHVVLFLMGDEEAEFPVEKINHKSIHTWVQNPHMGIHDDYNKLGTGYPQHMKQYLPKKIKKTIEYYFAGQITHQRRKELLDVLLAYDPTGKYGRTVASRGFTQGDSKKDYYTYLSSAKVSPAPSGAIIVDSFRVFEALECMSLVIADQKDPKGNVSQYWDWLFGEEVQFAKVDQWDRWFGLVPDMLEDYPANVHRQTAWWIQYKRKLKHKILEQLYG